MKTKILSITLLLLFIGCSEEVKKIVKSSTIVQDIEKNKNDRIKSISFYKQYENAKRSAKESLNIKRNYAPAYFELGMAEKLLGNKIAAKIPMMAKSSHTFCHSV